MPQHLAQSSHLIAIILVAKSHAGGPKLVFHYPPNPTSPSSSLFSTSASAAPGWYGGASSAADTAEGSSESGWGDGDSSSDEDGGEEGELASKSGRGSTAGGKSSGMKGRGIWSREVDEDEDEGSGLNSNNYDLGREAMNNSAKASAKNGNGKEAGDAEWERILGFRTESLEKLLSPQKAFHKRKFEVGIDGCFYIGSPMFIRDDGLWRKKRRREKKTGKESYRSASLRDHYIEEDDDDEPVDMVPPPDSPVKWPAAYAAGYGHPSTTPSESGSTGLDNEMSMFHVVFVMNPPALEYQMRVKEIYDNVVRKFAKALKYEQARSDYVWSETRKILATKSKAKENGQPISTVWPTIISSSSLAKSIAVIYDSISSSKIAHVHLDNNFEASFQIPQAISTQYIPTAAAPQMPGLWLTTANDVDNDDADVNFTQHFALLLLEDSETLIKEIEGDSKNPSSPLGFYIRNLVPTKSLHKLSIAHSMATQDIEYIATRLVYWRRARLIPPLHPRDTYIVSPNADMRALSAAIPAYAARFPTLPSLPQILNMLSGVPRPYSSFFPTQDHRKSYMEILAWLMRGGWVTQLRTFAWVRVTPEIKADVAAIRKREKQEEAEAATAALIDEMNGRNSAHSDTRSSITSPTRPSPHLHPVDTPSRSPVRPSSNASTGSSNRTTLSSLTSPTLNTHTNTTLKRPSPLHIHQLASSPPSPITAKHSPQHPPRTPSIPLPQSPTQDDTVNYKPSLIISPQSASSEEARWLERIRDSFADRDVRELWPTIIKYLDGVRALEDIPVREGLKRKRVQAALGVAREEGWLVVVRHW